jgi:heparosan-N-sulfate-glucuronate 5-epimerase
MSPGSRQSASAIRYHEIECLINDESSIDCRQDDGDGEVFVPFSFIRKYFEVTSVE